MSQLELWTEQDEVALQYNEQIIEKGLETYMKVGYALMEIRDNRLYRKDFNTFEEYCQEKWGKSRYWAYNFIKASEVAGVLESVDNCQQIPETESQARPLTKLETPEQQAEAWSNAVANTQQKSGKPTAKEVDDEVKKLQAKLKEHEKALLEKQREIAQKEAEVANLKQSNTFVTTQLKEKETLIEGIQATLKDSAEALAQKMVEVKVKEATEPLQIELTRLKTDKENLETEKAALDERLKETIAKQEKALADFKANPDPETKKAMQEAQKELDNLNQKRADLVTEVLAIQSRIENTLGVEEHRANATRNVMSFFKKIEDVFETHQKQILSFSSVYLDDAYAAHAEDLIENLEEYIAKLKKVLSDRQYAQAKPIQSVDVEVVTDDDIPSHINYFPEPEEDDDDDF